MTLRVSCYAGYRSDQEPLAFWLGDRRLEVKAILDRWYSPTRRWFKISADDGHAYILRHDEQSDAWEMVAFTAYRHPVTP